MAETESEEDTSEVRLFTLRKLDQAFEKAKAVFARWKVSGKQLKEVFTKAMSNKTTVKDETAEESREEGGVRRPRQRSRDTDKVSTSDTKSLTLDCLETSMPPLQIKDWYRKWENYQVASGWGHGDNHRTQLAYLRTCVSDEIRTATDLDNLRTVQNALHLIKEYMKNTVMPVSLQRV